MATTLEPPSTHPETLQFPCPACGSLLAVSRDHLGAEGPCPNCHTSILSPTHEEWEALRRSPRPELPPKPTAPAPVMPVQKRSREERVRERLRQTKIPRIESSGPSLAQLLGWGSVILAVLAGGFSWAVAKYTVPVKPAPVVAAVPADLTLRVLAEKRRMEVRREQGIQESINAVERLFQLGSEAQPALGIFSASGATHHFEQGLFPALHAADLHASACVRKTGSEDFLITIEPKDGGGPVVLLEQQAGQFQLHADAFTQQIDDTLADFLEKVGEGSLTAYVLARPSQVQFPLEELVTWTKWDLQNPFPNARVLAFVASAQPDSPLAGLLASHRDAAGWMPLVMKLQWSKTTDGKPFIEMLETVPTAWSKF